MMQEVEVLKTIQELICSFFSEEQFTLSKPGKYIDTICDTTYTTTKGYNKCRNGIN